MMFDNEFSADAACRPGSGVDAELFFPFAHSRSTAYAEQVADAIKVCDVCPVKAACLTFALNAGIDYGVFGGQSAEQRRVARAPQSRGSHSFRTEGGSPGRALPWSARPRGTCSACKTRQLLRVDGTTVRHRRTNGICIGSGEHATAGDPVTVGGVLDA